MMLTSEHPVRLVLRIVLLALALPLCNCGSSSSALSDANAFVDLEAQDQLHIDSNDSEPNSNGDSLQDLLPPLNIPKGCNPLAAEWDCMLPFPSDYFLVDDPSMPSGRRLAISGAGRLERPDGLFVEPYLKHPVDGFSHHPPILVLFPGGVDAGNLVSHTGNVADSLEMDCSTVLLDADNGERVLHFAEMDPNPETDAERVLFIRPMVRLRNGTRYIVAIRNLRHKNGDPIDPPEGFRRIRDGQTQGDLVLAPLATPYEEDLFPALESAGVERSTLQFAWDFTTETEECVTGDMLTMRADLISRMEQSPPAVTITSVTEPVNDRILRQVDGTIRVPLYVDSEGPTSRINRDAGGNIVAIGEAEVPFTLRIPTSLQGDSVNLPARVLQYGHGFFAQRNEVESGWLDELAERHGFVLAAVDWWGMSVDDLDDALESVMSAPSSFLQFTDRLHQGMANQIALNYALAGPLSQLMEVQIDGVGAIDPAQVYFYGASQGGILGGTYATLGPLVSKAVLSVAGGSFTLMMFRSRYFASFLILINQFIASPLDAQKWVALLATTFDRIDPITYAPHGIHDLYPKSPPMRTVLMQNAIGDSDVTNLSSHLLARAFGVRLLQPSPRTIPFLETVEAPAHESAIVEFDFNVPEPLPGTEAAIPKTSTGGHEGVRHLRVGMQQIDAFLRPEGLIEHTCDGLCDPE